MNSVQRRNLTFLIAPVFFVIMPYAFKKVIGFSSIQFGYLQTFFMMGLLVGNIIIGTFSSKASAKRLIQVGFFSQIAVFALFSGILFPQAASFFGGASWSYFGVLGALLTLMGIFNTAVNIPVQTNLQKMVRSEMCSRFFSVLGLAAQLVVPVGSVLYGFLLDRISAHLIVMTISIIIAAVALIFVAIATNEVYEPHTEFQRSSV